MCTLTLEITADNNFKGFIVKINDVELTPQKKSNKYFYTYEAKQGSVLNIDISSPQKGLKVSWWEIVMDTIFGFFGSISPDPVDSKVVNFKSTLQMTSDTYIKLDRDEEATWNAFKYQEIDGLSILCNEMITDPSVKKYNKVRKNSFLIIMGSIVLIIMILLIVFVFTK